MAEPGRAVRCQLGDPLDRRRVGELDRQLPLRNKLANEAVIRRVAPRLRWIVRPLRFGSRARFVRRARQRVQARPAQRNDGVARQHRRKQEVSNDSRHRNIVDRR